ncbi:MAG: hypothetical protein V4668_02840 [Patescibacteria group bacterium]
MIAFVIFMVMRAISRFKKKEAVKPTVTPEPSDEVKLLIEIRDSLRRN